MRKYIVRRLIISVVTILVIATCCFFLLRILPGNPFSTTELLSQEQIDRMMHYYGMDKPLFEQYLTYMKNLLHGDFGSSLKHTGCSVNQMIMERFPASAQLGLEAFLISFPLGMLFGIVSALRKGTAVDYALVIFTVLGVCVPVFIVAALLQYVFAIRLGWFPVAQWKGFHYTVLPVLTLSICSIANRTRAMLTLMLEVINEDYMKTAKAKGLSKFQIVWRHQIRNAVIPMLPSLGMEIVELLMGSFVVEQIFVVPGLGAYFVNSIQNLDYTMTLGLTVFLAIFVVSANFIIDLIYGLVDPRIRVVK